MPCRWAMIFSAMKPGAMPGLANREGYVGKIPRWLGAPFQLGETLEGIGLKPVEIGIHVQSERKRWGAHMARGRSGA